MSYQEPSPKARKQRQTLWIGLGVAGSVLVLACIFVCVLAVIGGAVYFLGVNSPTLFTPPTRQAGGGVPVMPDPPSPAPATPIPNTPDLVEEAIRNLEAITTAEVPYRDQVALAERLRGLADPPTTIPTPDYRLGDVEMFYVNNLDTDTTLQIKAELVYIGEHVYMWVEQDFPYDYDALKESADRFSQDTYRINRQTFGSEPLPGVDGDERLHILHSTELGSSIAGYFGSSDVFPASVMEYSNQREMFYINIGNTYPGSTDYDSTLAHEFQHMIHWNVDRNETTWLNEGMSELAAFLNGYGPSGFMYAYLSNPTIQLTDWPEDDDTLPHYGGAYLFVQYFYDRFGYEAVRALVANGLNGMESVDDTLAAVGAGVSADEVFIDWRIANLINDPATPHAAGGGSGLYAYTSAVPLSTPATAAAVTAYPFTSGRQQVSQYGVYYASLSSPGGSGTLAIRFDGEELVRAVPIDTVNTDGDPVTDDDTVWWSNRGDDSNMTLTRAVDLRGVDQAVLTYDLWYWIEYGWDFGYVEVSTDGGQTFTILETAHTSDYNPFGNAYGVGYTGRSSDAPDADEHGWVSETVDLSAYVGQEILLRFEMITDDAVNQPGMALDNICIEAIGLCDDAETDIAGWEARGFVRHSNVLPQRFAVQVVLERSGGRYEVLDMLLDGENQGELTIDMTGSRLATLVVSGLTRFTTEPAIFSYQIATP